MAKGKKDFSDIASDNKNLGGVNALFNKNVPESPQTAKEKEVEPEVEEDLKNYPLRIERYIFQNMDLRRVNTGVPIRQQIKEALIAYWQIEKPKPEK